MSLLKSLGNDLDLFLVCPPISVLLTLLLPRPVFTFVNLHFTFPSLCTSVFPHILKDYQLLNLGLVLIYYGLILTNCISSDCISKYGHTMSFLADTVWGTITNIIYEMRLLHVGCIHRKE